MEFNESIAYVQHPDGTKIQVLNEAGDDWDEVATQAAYNDYVNGIPPTLLQRLRLFFKR